MISRIPVFAYLAMPVDIIPDFIPIIGSQHEYAPLCHTRFSRRRLNMARQQDERAVETARPVGTVLNLGEPLRFVNVEPLAGFSAGPAQTGEVVKIWTRLALTSDHSLFHRVVENLDRFITHVAQQAGTLVHLSRAATVLLVFKANKTAELWLDTAAVSLRCLSKRSIAAGTAVFEHDIADVTGMAFPCVNLELTDKVLCLFRQGWSFGLAFDFNPDGKLDIEAFTTNLGRLYRELRYRHLYEAIGNVTLFEKLVASGWFPFVEIVTSEFQDFLHHCEAGSALAEIEDKLIESFDEARLLGILERWVAKPHFAAKEALLKEAVDAFVQKKPVAVIKILLTEIEGVLNDAFRATHGGQGAKLKELLAFAQASAEQRAGGRNTLLFPSAFGRYLSTHTFAHFDPVAQTGTAGSRHAVGHGAAAQESYTMPKALQAILTLDQLAFYT